MRPLAGASGVTVTALPPQQHVGKTAPCATVVAAAATCSGPHSRLTASLCGGISVSVVSMLCLRSRVCACECGCARRRLCVLWFLRFHATAVPCYRRYALVSALSGVDEEGCGGDWARAGGRANERGEDRE